MRQFNLLALLLAISPIVAACQESGASVAMVKMPYTGARNVPEKSGGPDYLEDGGITTIVQDMGVTLQPISTIALNEDDERQYGEWHRMGLANGHLADLVAQNVREGKLHVGLLGNCTSVIGTLGGLQKSGLDDAPLRVGLVFIDAHGDFNTPETLSGMLGGMPVAVSAGLGLRNLRLWSGLDPAIPTDHIVMGAVRDLDPLERELVEEHDIRMITVDDIRTLSDNLHQQMERLSSGDRRDLRPHRQGRPRSARGARPPVDRRKRAHEHGARRRDRRDVQVREGPGIRSRVDALR